MTRYRHNVAVTTKQSTMKQVMQMTIIYSTELKRQKRQAKQNLDIAKKHLETLTADDSHKRSMRQLVLLNQQVIHLLNSAPEDYV